LNACAKEKEPTGSVKCVMMTKTKGATNINRMDEEIILWEGEFTVDGKQHSSVNYKRNMSSLLQTSREHSVIRFSLPVSARSFHGFV
jgi:hypothetical protein